MGYKMKEKLLNLITQKFLGFLAILVFGYLMPEQLGLAISAYALFAGGNVAIDYIRKDK
jgi:hypothetical protein